MQEHQNCRQSEQDGNTKQMPRPIDIIEVESSRESTAPKTVASSQHVDHRQPHQLSSAGRLDHDRILAQNEAHQHGESCRDIERHEGNNIPERREKKGNEESIAGRDESAQTKSIMRGLRVVFLVIAMLILLGEVA